MKSVHYIEQMQMLMTGSWDKTIRYWDLRQQKMAASIPQPERVYAISAVENLAVVACAPKTIVVYDLRNPSKPQQVKEFGNCEVDGVECPVSVAASDSMYMLFS